MSFGHAATSQAPTENLAGLVERGDVPQRGKRLLRAAPEGARAARPHHRHRPCRDDLGWRVDPGGWYLDERPHARAAVPGHLPEGNTADDGRGHRALPRLGHDPRHRTGLREAVGEELRRDSVRRHRSRPRPPARGRGHRPRARRAHRRRLGRAEDRARDHAVPARPRRRHVPGGADLQDLRRRGGGGHQREPVPPRARHPRYRLQDGRPDRGEARHRQGRHGAGPRRRQLRPGGGDGRGPLRPARGRPAAHRRRAARGDG